MLIAVQFGLRLSRFRDTFLLHAVEMIIKVAVLIKCYDNVIQPTWLFEQAAMQDLLHLSHSK